VLWAAVAERLKRPVVSQAAELTVDLLVRVKRQTEFGYDVIESPPPAVVAVATRSTSRATRRSRGSWREEEAVRDPVAGRRRRRRRRGGEAGSKTEVLALGRPSRGDARKIEGDANAAQAIVDFLAEKRLV
jgi:electron transfer flavoprotein alpha/beta subunit